VFLGNGVEPAAAAQVTQAINRDPEVALRLHIREELGGDPSALPARLVAAVASLVSCALGGLIPLLPFLLGSTSLARPDPGAPGRLRQPTGSPDGAWSLPAFASSPRGPRRRRRLRHRTCCEVVRLTAPAPAKP